MASVRDVSRIITKARTRDEDQQERYGRMVEQMIRNGYPASCVDTILKYASNNLWKD
jgi:serine protein kinase